jgi:hypothetical protein
VYNVALLSAEVFASVVLSIGEMPQAVRLLANARKAACWLKDERAQDELTCETAATEASKKQPDVTWPMLSGWIGLDLER